MRHTDTIRLSQKTAAAAPPAAASGSTRLTGFQEILADTVDAASLISGGSPAPSFPPFALVPGLSAPTSRRNPVSGPGG